MFFLKPTTSNSTVNVTVSQNNITITLSSEFNYDYTNTPIVTSVTPSNLTVLGKW